MLKVETTIRLSKYRGIITVWILIIFVYRILKLALILPNIDDICFFIYWILNLALVLLVATTIVEDVFINSGM